MKSVKMNFVIVFMALSLLDPAWSQASDEVGKVVSVSGQVLARVESKVRAKKDSMGVRTLRAGDAIFRSDVINTGSEGSVKILFQDESIMDLGQSSLFKVDQFENKSKPENRKVELSLSYGKIRAAINQKIGPSGKFKVKTRAATMGVRGTEFYVMSDIESSGAGKESKSEAKNETPRTQVVVTEGKVEVAKSKGPSGSGSEKPVAVHPGEKFTAVIASKVDTTETRSPASEPGSLSEQPVGVEKVSAEEMKVVVSEVKLKDTTFSQAIQIETPKASESKGGDSSGASTPFSSGAPSPVSFAGAETLSAIKDTLLAKPELSHPSQPATNFTVPGIPVVQPNFAGNFMPGFNSKFVKLHIIIK